MDATGRLARSCTSSNRFVTIRCVALVPTEALISSADAVRCGTVMRRTRRYPLSVVAQVPPDPVLLETVSSRDHCCQQSCSVGTSLPSLSAISRKEN
ncbi:hypothetical protein AVEN_200349-1 [Araneus ventricosus]|uniref:Uncharacterized protein n=1 Tax=Araneus ventricosus TaxID=182803 RepID=A0A4Y2UP83_ARAVE|nr:hypothetical protein AVEN_200349-1 [Araneus ventricosus]